MKILHLATQDKGGGGGGFDAAYRLHSHMRSAGLSSMMAVLHKNTKDKDVLDVGRYLSRFDRLRRYFYQTRRRLMIRFFRMSPYFISIESQGIVESSCLASMFPFQPDIIIAHWVSGFVTTSTLRDLHKITGAPILWYFMDMAPMTGGCHYAFDCDAYTRGCGFCPQIGIWKAPNDLSHRQWQLKKACLDATNITAVCGSTWLRNQVASASLFQNKRQELILLSCDIQVFCPVSQNEARKKLDLPNDRKIIFFGASKLNEDRKGIRYLVKALRLLHTMLDDDIVLRDKVLLVTAGWFADSPELDIGFEHRHVGVLVGDVSLACAYQAADVFVNASIEDSGPMMVNESLLCGTPVVSFEMGVAVDLVLTDRTGYLARLKDEQDMATGLLRILELNNEAYLAMREHCRDYGLQRCHPDVQVREFEEICRELITKASDKS